MKKLFLLFIFLLSNLTIFADSSWPCSEDSDCPEGTTCHAPSSSCRADKDKVVDYATIRLTTGANNPNSFGSGTIFVQNPANNLVAGQLAVSAFSGNGDGKFYYIQELSVEIAAPSSIKFDNFRLVYDANGNGVADSSEKVIAEGNISAYTVKFEIDQKLQAFKINQTENFLIVASFSTETDNNLNLNFYTFIKDKDSILTRLKGDGQGEVEYFKNLSFPKFSFEPENGYFLFTSGKHFSPQIPPSWRDLNKEWEIMHLRLKALDRPNELSSLKINIYGTSASFGNGIEKISLCTDKNNDGKCDDVISEFSDFSESQQNVIFQIPEGKISLNQGEETFLVIKADMNFYKDQNASFYISEPDVTLKTKQKIAGTTIKTVTFSYNCSEDDPDCRLKPEENNEEDNSEQDDDSGCSILFID